MSDKEVSLVLRLEGGIADDGLLDVYDAANTIYGLARAVNLVSHSFANDEEVRKKNQSAQGAKAFIHSSKKGCFEEQVDIRFDKKVVQKIGHSVLANTFWDYLNWTWHASVGFSYEPKTAQVIRIAESNDLFIYEIADALEGPMQLIHRAISYDNTIKAFLYRPRVGDALELTSGTLDYVSIREEQTQHEYMLGNITRVNVLSQFGRLFSDEEGRVISFELANPDDKRVRGLALKSMQEHNEGETGKMHLKVTKIVSAQGVVKRYIVHDILENN
ncbi:hypothetical protein [Jeongeupia sp. USM3]|uniref:DUF7946 domain-containing protein n=1 Tax=Jeongeupia sp. USM3 TaxID=1906741 RepID=UPI000AA489B7|nr:hypothetical protein [Jeongeupia sp. USM3]